MRYACSRGAPVTAFLSPRRRRHGFTLAEWLAALVITPVALCFAVRAVTGSSGMARIGDDQVAVVLHTWSGEKELVTNPGYRLYLPWLEEVHCFDKSPNGFVFEGNNQDGFNHVPRLIARARDGSSYWFEEFHLQYALSSDKAALVLDDSGPGDQWKEALVRSFARSVLRDEVGRYTTEEIAQVPALRAATRASLERLNRLLGPHGIEVLEVATPQPRFDKQYEDKIVRRKNMDQDHDRLSAELEQLGEERLQAEAAARRDKEVELRKLEGNLAADLKAATKENLRVRSEADSFYIEKTRAAAATKFEKEQQAAVLTARNVSYARDLFNQSKGLERYGELAVRMALVQKLSGIEFNLLPYSKDPAPQRMEFEAVGPASMLLPKK